MTRGTDDLRPRPGRIRDHGPSGRRATRFVGEVLRAARKAGHTGPRFGHAGRGTTIGRGRFARSAASLRTGRTVRIVVASARSGKRHLRPGGCIVRPMETRS